ncbi:MAG: excinuclease ABC subunit UvrC [Candidatus Heimdallarchaeota archaeon]|nr:excinuclease ABC subunit UvrC [Candidatus Heimdallarchaeota archaeon]
MSLLSDLESLPLEPGVYLIKDKDEKIVYVGKAKNIRNRVKQHFQPTHDSKEDKLQELANRIDWVITRNESEALILEKKLVKQLSPKLNSQLKDDKSHLLIRLSLEEEYPQFLIERETDSRVPKSVYFGPFTNDTMLKQTAKLVLKLFPICNCGKCKEQTRKSKAPLRCMRERLRRCLAPCLNDISPEEYGKTVKNVVAFLKGDVADLLDNLEKEMWVASEQSNFEKAANLRDLVQAVYTILNIQEDLHSKKKNVALLAFKEEGKIISFCKLEIREHRIHNIKTFIYDEEEDMLNLGEVLTYIYGIEKPKHKIQVSDNFILRFKNDINFPVLTIRGNTAKQLNIIAEKNANTEMKKYLRELKYHEDSETVLEEMKTILGLTETPEIIHGFDISTLKGQHSVGSCVVFANGKPKKDLYRRFRIRKEYSDSNDYAMMKEVISRRYKSETLKKDPIPNLLIIDGGKGQLSVAIKVLKELHLSIPSISIAKKNEEIFVENQDEPIVLEQRSTVLRLIQYVRDESHRFAINYHKKLREKSVKRTIFEDIKGIGKSKVQALFHEYKSIQEIANSEVAKMQKVLAVNEEIAIQVINMAKKVRVE